MTQIVTIARQRPLLIERQVNSLEFEQDVLVRSTRGVELIFFDHRSRMPENMGVTLMLSRAMGDYAYLVVARAFLHRVVSIVVYPYQRHGAGRVFLRNDSFRPPSKFSVEISPA